MDLTCHEQENYSALFNRQEHKMARTKRIALDYEIDAKLSLSPCHIATDPWKMTLCPMMPPQSPRLLSYVRTTMHHFKRHKNLLVPFTPFKKKTRHVLSCNILFLFSSNHFLGSRIAIKRRKQVNDLKTNVYLGFILPFITTVGTGR